MISMIDGIKAKHHDDLKTMCTVIGMLRNTYFQSKHKTESKTKRENRELTNQIREIHTESKECNCQVILTTFRIEDDALVS